MRIKDQLNSIFMRRNAWRSLFRHDTGELNKAGLVALADLQRFCHDNRSTAKVSPQTGQIDPYAMAMAEGRREVWLRIKEYLKLDDRDLQALLKQHNDEVFTDE